LAILPPLVRSLVARCRGRALGFVVGWWVVLYFFLVTGRRVVQGHGQRSTGRVPSRRPFSVKIYCGSFESLRAMVLSLAMVFAFFFLIWCWHGWQRWWKMKSDGGKHRRSRGPLCNFCVCRVFCASCVR
jgi:predicted secreted protein